MRAAYWPPFKYLVYYPLALAAIPYFSLTGRTPHVSYISMRRLFCMTDGRSNRLLSRFLDEPARAAPHHVDGVLGALDAIALQRFIEQLDRDGYVKFDARLPAPTVAELAQAARDGEATIRGGGRARFDPAAPRGVRYDFDEAFITGLPAVQRLLMDPTLLAVASAYLRAEPVNDLVAMWWSAATGAPPDSAAAQLFHFDLDRLKFLKFFFYLTDVDGETGPHVYVEGSHRDKPPALRHDGRKDDAMVVQHYGTRVREITGPAGTILAVDTRGFHKGKPLVRGHRLMLQLEYAANLFGSPTTRLRLDERATPEFRAFVAAHPRMFSRFIT